MSEQIVKETITVERKKLEEIKAFVSPYDTARQLLDAILNPTPTMTKADWQRVIDEGFYIRYEADTCLFPLNDMDDVDDTTTVVREKGLRQPHFKGHPHPEGDGQVVVKYHREIKKPCLWYYAYDVDEWDNVREYIVL